MSLSPLYSLWTGDEPVMAFACPFCESHRLACCQSDNDKSYIICVTCKARGPEGETNEEAAERWNKASRPDA